MNPRPRPLLARTRLILALGLTALLAACGGGGTALTCDAADQKTWLRSFMGEWYFWYRLSPSPDPAGYATLADYELAVSPPLDAWASRTRRAT